MKTFTFAQAYVERQRWSVIPIPYKQKRACLPWKEFQHRRPTMQEVKCWFEHVSNLAIITGDVSNRLLVIDFDKPELYTVWHDQNRIESWAVTSGKGIHLYFRLAPGEEPPRNGKFCVNGQIAGDVRYNGGYVLAPPSIHPNGQTYRWACGGSSLVTLRFEDLKLTRPARKQTPRGQPKQRYEQSSTGAFPGLPAYVKCPKAYADAALTRECEKVQTASEGTRNNQVYASAVKLAKYGHILGTEWIRIRLLSAAAAVGLPTMEASRTINSGLNRALVRSV